MNVLIRQYRNSDCATISKLFYETIHCVNARDYTEKQLSAWAKDENRLLTRQNDLLKQKTLIAETDGQIVGFGSMVSSGCLDLLFVHKDFQRHGIATALCDELERGFTEIITYASITARAFFEKRGYTVIAAQEVERLGVKLQNYKMQKRIRSSL